MGILSNIEPKEVFHYFEELSMVPRSTFHTKKISDFCVEFAKAHNLEYIQDEVNNVIIKKPGRTVIRSSSRDIWTWSLQRQPTVIMILKMIL